MFLIHLNSTIKTAQNILQAFLRKHFLFQTQELYLTQNKPSVNPTYGILIWTKDHKTTF